MKFKQSKYGQWAYPGENTLIPNVDGKITMQGVGGPVLGIDDEGNSMMMMPGHDYQFPGNSVYEIPMYDNGGPKVKQRRGVKKNPDGSVSTHLMRAEYIPERGWVAFPSLFQDSKPYADDQQNWVDMSEEKDWMKIYEEAERRGEVYDFGEDKEAALAFGKGSWKDQLPNEGMELELTDDEVEQYRAGGYILEELHEGGVPHQHPHSTDPAPSRTPRVYTYKDHKDIIDSTANWDMKSDVPISSDYNEQIRDRLYSGNYGFDSKTGQLIKLDKKGRTKVKDPYVKESRKDLKVMQDMTQDEKLNYQQGKRDDKDWELHKKYIEGKVPVLIDRADAWRPNFQLTDKYGNTFDTYDKAGQEVFMTPAQKESYLKAMVSKNAPIAQQQMNNMFAIPASFTPAGLAIMGMHGATNLGLKSGPELVSNPGSLENWKNVGLDLAMASPFVPGSVRAIKRSAPAIKSNTRKLVTAIDDAIPTPAPGSQTFASGIIPDVKRNLKVLKSKLKSKPKSKEAVEAKARNAKTLYDKKQGVLQDFEYYSGTKRPGGLKSRYSLGQDKIIKYDPTSSDPMRIRDMMNKMTYGLYGKFPGARQKMGSPSYVHPDITTYTPYRSIYNAPIPTKVSSTNILGQPYTREFKYPVGPITEKEVIALNAKLDDIMGSQTISSRGVKSNKKGFQKAAKQYNKIFEDTKFDVKPGETYFNRHELNKFLYKGDNKIKDAYATFDNVALNTLMKSVLPVAGAAAYQSETGQDIRDWVQNNWQAYGNKLNRLAGLNIVPTDITKAGNIVRQANSRDTGPTPYDTLIRLDDNILGYGNIDFAPSRYTTILGGDFVNKADKDRYSKDNTVRMAQDWTDAIENDPQQQVGDRTLRSIRSGERPLRVKDIKSYYGVENGKLKLGMPEDFEPGTTIVPNRYDKGQTVAKALNVKDEGVFRIVDSKGKPIYQNSSNFGKIIFTSDEGDPIFVSFDSNPRSRQTAVDQVNQYIETHKNVKPIVLDTGRFAHWMHNPRGLEKMQEDTESTGNELYWSTGSMGGSDRGYNIFIEKPRPVRRPRGGGGSWKEGGSVDIELTEKEVAEYLKGGYILEELQNGGYPGGIDRELYQYEEGRKTLDQLSPEAKKIAIANNKKNYKNNPDPFAFTKMQFEFDKKQSDKKLKKIKEQSKNLLNTSSSGNKFKFKGFDTRSEEQKRIDEENFQKSVQDSSASTQDGYSLPISLIDGSKEDLANFMYDTPRERQPQNKELSNDDIYQLMKGQAKYLNKPKKSDEQIVQDYYNQVAKNPNYLKRNLGKPGPSIHIPYEAMKRLEEKKKKELEGYEVTDASPGPFDDHIEFAKELTINPIKRTYNKLTTDPIGFAKDITTTWTQLVGAPINMGKEFYDYTLGDGEFEHHNVIDPNAWATTFDVVGSIPTFGGATKLLKPAIKLTKPAVKSSRKLYNKVATGNTRIPYAWKSQAPDANYVKTFGPAHVDDALIQAHYPTTADYAKFKNIKTPALTDPEAKLLADYMLDPRLIKTRRPEFTKLMQKLSLKNSDDVEGYFTRIHNYNSPKDAPLPTKRGEVISLGDDSRSISQGVKEGPAYGGEGYYQRIVIPEKYANQMKQYISKVPYEDPKLIKYVTANKQNIAKLKGEKEFLTAPGTSLEVIGTNNTGHYKNLIARPTNKKATTNFTKPDEAYLKKEYDIEIRKKGLENLISEKDFIKQGMNAPVEDITNLNIKNRTFNKTKEDIINQSKGYKSWPEFRNEGTIDDIYTGFEKGKPMKPIILLDQGDGSRRIISGNTRLNVAEQLNIPPKAITVNQSGVPIELGKHRSLHGPGFKQGGFIDAELTEDEVLDLLQKGYNLEELCKG